VHSDSLQKLGCNVNALLNQPPGKPLPISLTLSLTRAAHLTWHAYGAAALIHFPTIKKPRTTRSSKSENTSKQHHTNKRTILRICHRCPRRTNPRLRQYTQINLRQISCRLLHDLRNYFAISFISDKHCQTVRQTAAITQRVTGTGTTHLDPLIPLMIYESWGQATLISLVMTLQIFRIDIVNTIRA